MKSWILLCLSSLLLTSCIDLAVNESKNKGVVHAAKGEIYTMRGGLGGLFSKGMNRLQDTLEMDHHLNASSTIWYKQYALSNNIIKRYRAHEINGPIILVGHSLGANDQIKVARSLYRANVPVALLIIVDAVSPQTVPPNVKEVLNIYKPALIPTFSGHVLKAMDPKRTHIVNLNVTDLKDVNVNHFNIDSHPYTQKIMREKIFSVLKTNRKI